MRFLPMIVALFFAAPLYAQDVQTCDGFLRVGGVVNVTDVSGKAYANGAVRFAVVHDGRDSPTDGMFLAVFSPSPDADARKQCHVVGRDLERGYAAIALNASVADYDSISGLTVQVPARIYVPEEGFTNSTLLSINVNQATHEVTVTEELGNG